jgi:DNA-binding transcriptional ArsR family regulator
MAGMDSAGGDAHIAAVARLFADGTRAAMCTAMLDGRYWTAGELARCAGVAASTASEHLSQLVAGQVLEAFTAGRHRYFRLAGPDVAAALEALALLSPVIPVRTLRQGNASQALRAGRTCYDHLAGQLGVSMTELLIGSGVITPGFGIGDLSPLAPLDLKLPEAASRPLVRPCVDWTERRHHAAGLLPAALTRRLLELEWLIRTSQQRVVKLTDRGRAGLADLLPASVSWPAAE